MTTQPVPNQNVPVYVGPLSLTSYVRSVQICRLDGTLTHHRPCSTTAEFETFANEERPGVDLSPEAGQIYWDNGNEGLWPRDPGLDAG